MIKNKIINIKIILKIHLKILKTSLKHFRFSNRLCSIKHKERFFKTILKNYFLELFSKIFTKQVLMVFNCFL